MKSMYNNFSNLENADLWKEENDNYSPTSQS